MDSSKEFKKYATKHVGISSTTLHSYTSAYHNYINPTITEEITENRRQVTMDVFSRLMQDRIIFLGVPMAAFHPVWAAQRRFQCLFLLIMTLPIS